MLEAEYKKGSGLRLAVSGHWEIDEVFISIIKDDKTINTIGIPRVMLEDVIKAMRKEVEGFDVIDESYKEYCSGEIKPEGPEQYDFDFLKDIKKHKCSGGCSCHTS